MAKVYVVQDSRRYDKESGQYVSVHDISPAAQFGEVRYLLTPTAAPWNPGSVLNDLWEGLRDFCDDDYLLMIGNPVLCGLATAVASEVNEGVVNFLQWSGRDKCYTAVEVQVFGVAAAQPRG